MQLRHLFIAAVFSTVPLLGASAEPQILGLLAQNEAIPLTCTGAQCSAEFSAFCMEPDRSSPGHQTAYTPTADADLVLVATAADGSERRLPAADYASFANVRGFTSVLVSVPTARLEELGATSIALEVGERVSLLPQPSPKYNRPHEPQEVALTTGPRRVMGQRVVDHGGATADAARLISRMLNRLPVWGTVSDEARDTLWRQAIAEPGYADPGGKSVRLARGAYELCRSKDPAKTMYSFRQCLEGRHDKLIWELNQKYWLGVAGS